MPFEGLPKYDDPHDDCTHWVGNLPKPKGEIKDDTEKHRKLRKGT